MKKLILCIVFAFHLVAYSQQPNREQPVHFKIEVALDDNQHTLIGFQTITYTNTSPDTLYYIWMHLWPNAYKNDKTAYSEYRLLERKTDFYFSTKKQRGYINQLDFKVDGAAAKVEDHPIHIDIVKINFHQPLVPGKAVTITTPFHVQLPANFSGNGYKNYEYEIAQWHPQPAVYDESGWHPLPFETKARSYSQKGNYEVVVTLPIEYSILIDNASQTLAKQSGSAKSIRILKENSAGLEWIATKPKPVVIKKQPATPIKRPYVAEKDKQLIILSEVLPAKIFDTSRPKKVSLLPAVGYNQYDGLMLAGVVHNYLSQQDRLQFVAIPMYGTTSKTLAGIGRVSYNLKTYSNQARLDLALDVSRFSTRRSLDSNDNQTLEGFYKFAPSIRYTLKSNSAVSSLEKWIELKSFLIGESSFERFHQKSTDGRIYVEGLNNDFRYLNQLTYAAINNRVLYPYNYHVQLQQASDFYRLNITGNYFFNYANGGGANVRLFGAKFGYINKTLENQFNTYRYHPKLTGNTGEDDYTYSNYFLGRTASISNPEDAVVKNRGIGAQQIMIRDGGFKLRTDQYSFMEGRSDNWVLAMNLNTTLPQKLFPFKLPVKLFLDLGTTAEAWESSYEEERFLYNAGIQISLFREVLNIYVPILYSSLYKDYFNSWPKDKRLWRTLSFSIDVQKFRVKKNNTSIQL